MKHALLLSTTLLALATACSHHTAAPTEVDGTPVRGGVNGSVVSGPSCPVVSAESPCPDRPWQGTVRAVRPDGRPAGDARTTRQGDFLLTLPPGVYDIAPVTTGAASTRPQRVTVPPIGLITIHLTVDSGIR